MTIFGFFSARQEKSEPPGVAQKDAVFGRFYQVDKNPTKPGSGPGLSLARAIAKAHEALIELSDNNPGFIVKRLFALSANLKQYSFFGA